MNDLYSLAHIVDTLGLELGAGAPALAQQAAAPEGVVHEGSRNEVLSREAFRHRKRGLDPAAIYSVISAMNNVVCSPPLDEEEVRAIAEGKAKIKSEASEIIGAFEDLGPGEPAEGAPVAGRFDGQHIAAFAAGGSMSWIIRDILPRAELAVIIGEPGAGKSFLAFDLAAAIAQGLPWGGFKTLKGRVAYVIAEGTSGGRTRAQAYAKHRGIALEELDVVMFPHAPNLLDKADARDLAGALKKHGRFVLIVVDTLAQTSPGGNENSFEDVSRVLANCRALHNATGALICLIHHVGKDKSKGARGHSSLKGAADTEITVERSGHSRLAKVSKMKDGEDGLEIPFRLVTVELGKDEEGKPVASCVVELLGDQGGRSKPEPKGPLAAPVWDAVRDLAELGGGTATVAAVQDRVVPTIAYDPDTGRRDQRKYQVISALNRLRDARYLSIYNGVITPLVGVK
jgi:hypothetical protein